MSDVLNYKPLFQQFVEANQALLACYHNVPSDLVEDATPGKLDMQCIKEKQAVKSILEGNQMTMSRLVRERYDVLVALNR